MYMTLLALIGFGCGEKTEDTAAALEDTAAEDTETEDTETGEEEDTNSNDTDSSGGSDTDGTGDTNDTNDTSDNTDPAENPEYIGGYNTNLCASAPNPNGYAIGDVSYDAALMDQHGEMVSLSDFCGNTVLLVLSTAWCGACKGEAPELEALYQEYKNSNFTVITMLAETNSGQAPTQSDLQQWASDYGLSHPVLADDGFGFSVNYMWANPTFAGSIALPNMQLLSNGMVVETSNDRLSSSEIISYINAGN